MTVNFEKHIQPDNINGKQKTILDCLSENTDLSKQQLKRVMQNGAVWLESSYGIDRCRRAKKIIKQGDKIHLYYDADVQAKSPPVAELIADEGDYSIWNKPSGMYSQGSKWGDHCTIYRWAEQNLVPQRPAFIVHRLDRAANGLIILAHKKTVAARFSKMFEKHELYKKYRATVEGVITGIMPPYEINLKIDNKKSISEIVSLKVDDINQTTVVEVVIKTGRKHQIRRHLSGLGYPIMGDRLYGAKNLDVDLQLSSVTLKFKCPVTNECKEYNLDT